ncbi:MAG: diadenylate cyclase CdaA [Polyangiaceae bacterium]
MPEWFLHLFPLFAPRPWSQVGIDILDLAIVTVLVYRGLLVLRGTRAMQMGVGLGVIFVIYGVSKMANLVTLHNLLSSLLSSVILIVVVVFQNDIRRGLMRVGSRAWLSSASRQQESRVVDEVVAAAQELARHRMGALICFEQEANLDEFVVGQGTVIDAAVQRELLVGLFVPESVNKLHDGAVVIRNLRVAKAGVFFPMPDTKMLDKSLGSRHRAALGITEETDAVVVVVSEERGTISFCFNGNIISNLDGASLRQALLGLFGQQRRKKKTASKKDGPQSRKDRQTGSYRISIPPSGVPGSGAPVSSGVSTPVQNSPALMPPPVPAIVADPTPSESEISVAGPRLEPAEPVPMAPAPKIDTPNPEASDAPSAASEPEE